MDKTRNWTRRQRIFTMDKEILDVAGAARVLGVSTGVVYSMAQAGKIPGTKVGREWRFSRQNLINWVANGSEADQLTTALRNGRVTKRRT